MVQSNFVCIVLAVMGSIAFFNRSMSVMTTLSCLVLVVDALLGATLFAAVNQEDIYKELGLFQQFKKIKFSLN